MNSPVLPMANFDHSVRPADDLFRFANGTWLANTEIPADKPAWGSFMELRDKSQEAVRGIVESVSSQDLTTLDGKVTALYCSFMEEDVVEALGADPVRRLLGMVDAIDSPTKLADYLGWAARHGVSGLFDFGPDSDPGNPSRYVLFFGQGGLGLPDEAYYREEQHAQVLAAYRTHIKNMLQLLGEADAAAQADLIVDLETRIAATHWDNVRTRDLQAMYNLQSWDEFKASAVGFDWNKFNQNLQLPPSALAEVVNAQPSFFTEAAQLVTAVPMGTWRAWARWHLLHSLAPLLSSEFVAENFDFYARTLAGTPEQQPRWRRGVNLVESVMGEGIGRLYVERYFPAESKARMDELVANLLLAYRHSITELDWMTDATKAEALDKLSKFKPKIGYPDKWRDYSALIVTPDDLVGNRLRAASFSLDYHIGKMSGPVDPDEWLMFPQTVNAYYHPLRNEIVFPAAILQPPFFNPEADDAVNYGAIGAVIGHEIGHGFDDKGSATDGNGQLRNWWTPEDLAAFQERAQGLVDQYSALSPEGADGRHVNGELTLGENIGDLGGLQIAYQAWLLAGGNPDGEPIDGYTPAQRLFLGWACAWQSKSRPELVQQRLATDPHSPNEFRCNQVVANLPSFHAAFGVVEGDKLWLPPEARVKIW